MTRFHPIPIEPIGTRTSRAFVTRASGCDIETMTTPVYPPSPRGEELRRVRVAFDRTLGEAARLLGLRPLDVSDLEWGRATFATDEEWNAVLRALEGKEESL